MKEIITVNNNTLSVREINGNRVVTFKEIDTLHKRPAGTASRNFQANRSRFIENVDFYMLKPADFQNNEMCISGFEHEKINNRGTVMITESGYLMLVKSLEDDLAWEVQRQLTSIYFKTTPEVRRSDNTNMLIQLLTQQNQSILQSISSMQESYAAQQQQLTALTTLITATIPQQYKPPFTHWMNTALKRADVIAAANTIGDDDDLRIQFDLLLDTYIGQLAPAPGKDASHYNNQQLTQ